MVEVLSDAYALSGKIKFLDAARRFTRDNFAAAMSGNRDDLSGRHSNFSCADGGRCSHSLFV